MLVLGVAVAGLVYTRMQAGDVSWKIDPAELAFPSPVVVLGRGTYGQVLPACQRF